jgi:iron-sulfur cluster repair protein YtfE (RIC family)
MITGREGIADAFEVVLDGRECQRGLCRDLETLADRLGVTVDEGLAERCLAYLHSDLAVHQRDEEAVYRLLGEFDTGDGVAQLIRLATNEHIRHREYACELSEWLEAALHGRAKCNPDALGYLLRCMFDNLSQHLAWEEVTLFGTARQTRELLSGRDLAGQLARNRRAHPARLRLIYSVPSH